jgi:hypothetical protein
MFPDPFPLQVQLFSPTAVVVRSLYGFHSRQNSVERRSHLMSHRLALPSRLAGICAVCMLLGACQGDRIRDLEQRLAAEKTSAAQMESALRQQLRAAEIDRDGLKQQVAQIEQARQAALFSETEYQRTADAMASDAGAIGRLLLSATHPSGVYHRAGVPSITLTDDRSAVLVQLGVTWQGLILEQPYTTVYRFRLGKHGVERLEIVRDEAIAAIEPEFLRQAEVRLHNFLVTGATG